MRAFCPVGSVSVWDAPPIYFIAKVLGNNCCCPVTWTIESPGGGGSQQINELAPYTFTSSDYLFINTYPAGTNPGLDIPPGTVEYSAAIDCNDPDETDPDLIKMSTTITLTFQEPLPEL